MTGVICETGMTGTTAGVSILKQGTDRSQGIYVIEDMGLSGTQLFRMSPISPALCWIGGSEGPAEGDPALLFPTTTFSIDMQLLHDREWLIHHGWYEPDPIKLEPKRAFRIGPRSQWLRMVLVGQWLPLTVLLPTNWMDQMPIDIFDKVGEPGVSKFLDLWKSAPDFAEVSSSDITTRTADQIV